MAADTRNRMIEATIAALQRRGVAGMSFTEVLADSGAARGGIYHHFPGGKSQLIAEAATQNGQDIRDHFALLPADDPVAVVEAFLAAVRPVVEASTGGGGCAVAAVTVGTDLPDDPLHEVAATAFGSWISALAGQLAAAGLSPDEARDLATTLITMLEGAHILCRAAADLGPFDNAARTILQLVSGQWRPGEMGP